MPILKTGTVVPLRIWDEIQSGNEIYAVKEGGANTKVYFIQSFMVFLKKNSRSKTCYFTSWGRNMRLKWLEAEWEKLI